MALGLWCSKQQKRRKSQQQCLLQKLWPKDVQMDDRHAFVTARDVSINGVLLRGLLTLARVASFEHVCHLGRLGTTTPLGQTTCRTSVKPVSAWVWVFANNYLESWLPVVASIACFLIFILFLLLLCEHLDKIYFDAFSILFFLNNIPQSLFERTELKKC